MKKNLILFGVFILLMGLTYVFQEKRVEKEHAAADFQDRLIQEEVVHLKLPRIEATKKKDQWWKDDQLLSHNVFKQVEKKLTEIKKIKEVQGDWKSFFSNPFSFEVNHVVWTVGDLSLDKQGFYIAKDKKIYLAMIEGESTHLTQDEREIAGIKLNELLSFLSKDSSELLENQFFRFFPNVVGERVVLNVDGSLPFELNLKKNTTEPPPIPGINGHKDLRGKFFSLFTQMMIKEEIPYSENLKFKKLGSLTFLDQTKKTVFELWLKSKDSADAVIIEPDSKRTFSMAGGSLKLFFIQVQDYWDKKVIPQEFFVSFTKLETVFSQKDKSERIVILNREPLGFESKKFKADQAKLEVITSMIFNLGSRDQADRVSLLSKSERKQILSEDHLRIEVMGQSLLIWRKKEEVIVVNLTQGFKAHFGLVDENFLGTFEDVLK